MFPSCFKKLRSEYIVMRAWAIAGSGILTHTITDERLAQAGYFDILAKYESLHI